MILDITTHDHPALRTKGKRIEKFDERLRQLADDMIETMREADGIGLAAQQVGRPIRMFVLEVPQMRDRPSAMRIDGKPVDFEAMMPMVLINPEVEAFGRRIAETEGCLSFPGLRGDVDRPLSVRVRAQLLDGREIAFEADGLLARAVQHELDHLDGVLFIDRVEEEDFEDLPDDVQQLARRR